MFVLAVTFNYLYRHRPNLIICRSMFSYHVVIMVNTC